MGVLPVIVRELRAQARQPATHWLRVAGAGALGLAFVLGLVRLHGVLQQGMMGVANAPQLTGAYLFGSLNLALFLALWLGVPLLTSDAISRERREGTLGLLFLTPLRSWQVVAGKAAAHVLRALTLFLTMLPWLLVPVLLGGVGWRDVAMAVLLDATILVLALSAGLLASCWSEDWLKTALLAEALSMILGLVFLESHRGVFQLAVAGGVPVAGAPAWGGMLMWSSGAADSSSRMAGLLNLLGFGTSNQMQLMWTGAQALVQSSWSVIWATLPASAHLHWFAGVGALLAAALFACALAVAAAAWRVAASWRDQPQSSRHERVRRRLLEPRFGRRWFRSRRSRALERNPVGWLEQRTAQARLVKWGWCALAMLGVVFLAGSVYDLIVGLAWVKWLVLLSLAFSASASFRRELESGVLELLLVTPLRASQIIAGRLRGLWMQYLPAVLVVLTAYTTLPLPSLHQTFGGQWASLDSLHVLVDLGVFFVSLPVVGLMFSLQRLHFLSAWLATCVVGIGIPWLILRVAEFCVGRFLLQIHASAMSAAVNAVGSYLGLVSLSLLAAVAAWVRLNRQLRRRAFAVH